jgi:hypothetical protein
LACKNSPLASMNTERVLRFSLIRPSDTRGNIFTESPSCSSLRYQNGVGSSNTPRESLGLADTPYNYSN